MGNNGYLTGNLTLICTDNLFVILSIHVKMLMLILHIMLK